MRSIYLRLLEQISQGNPLVLATVIHTAGSAPQKPGSSALFGQTGLLAGTVGGGILEGEAQRYAEGAIASGYSDYFHVDLNQEPESDGAICGGEASVLIDAEPSVHQHALEAMEESLSSGREGMLLTTISKKSGQGKIISRRWIGRSGAELDHEEMDPLLEELPPSSMKKAQQEGFATLDLASLPKPQVEMAYLEYFKPLPRLLIFGGGHVGKALAHLGSLLDFEIILVDDRPEFASKENTPDANQLIVNNAGRALQAMEIDSDSYIVIVTRGHQHDSDALRACIGSAASYIGMIGSRHKVALMKKQFLEEGWATADQWEAIHAPIGMPIGSQSVQEIAVSIAAQLIQIRAQKKKSHGK